MNPHLSPRQELRGLTLMGFAVLAVIFMGVGGWAVVTPIAGAVITQGSLVVESHVKKVQHPQGGVVTAIHKHNGDWVEAGELLARLDDTVARANMLVASKALDELDAKRARLEAERENWPAPIFPDRLSKRAEDPVVAQVMANERSMYESRKLARRNLEKQLERKIEQLRQEIPALQSQHFARGKEIELVEKELKGARELAEKKL
ncbi:MAG: HlyD family type I secretion periplasmic adaptor subunit, partial [Magnetococcales bacterium]|nr:HlyD family type I secretion periplasmic adaptor subunit [Magnetococcales bacterium]